MANKLVLLGGGGHCKSVIDVALQMKKFDEIVITDPHIPVGTLVMGCKVVGTDDCLKDLYDNGFEYAFITVGSVNINSVRDKLARKAEKMGFTFPIIIDPSAVVAGSAIIGKGTFIGKNVIINSDTKIGANCIINTGAIIEHECLVDDFTHVSIGCILCGEVSIGRNSFVGAGSTVIQCLNIGDDVVIGAGAVVNKDIPSKCTAVGIPAKVIKKDE